MIETASEAQTATEVGRRLFAALQPYGARAFFARSVRSLGPGHQYSYSRISPPGWEQIFSQRRFAESNFMLRELARRSEPFRWLQSEIRTEGERGLAQLLKDWNFPDGISAPIHGPAGYLGVTSMAFERLHELAPEERAAIGLAATVLHLRMRALTPPGLDEPTKLSPRERDCMALVAEGRSDWEIGERLGVAETTVVTHVQNARRKLGAKSRAQAVAVCVARGLF
jgi:DNA-binding CsgD family transcriptional regulator